MTKHKPKYELLAPAGDFACLIAAIKAGANAIYVGLKDFNMRDSAKNFSLKELEQAKKICKEKGVKIYLTLNTIIYDKEIKQIEKIIKQISKRKLVDAIICWDLSIIELCKKYKIPFHISTQASISNSDSANFYKKIGAERIILARELSLDQVKEIIKKTKIEVECFIHGAMCVSISGRCFTSQFTQNKSANRGQCTHPCRRTYMITDQTDPSIKLRLENNKVMSAKDLCTLPFLEKLKNAGVTSFKIEGRNRSPEYVYIVTKAYRKALDKKLSQKEIKESLEELKMVYNRGFSGGFYIHSPTNDDFTKSETGEQTKSKKFIGKIEAFWPKISVAKLNLSNGPIKIGDEIYIIGKKTGLSKTKIKSMQIENKDISQAEKGQEIGIKFETKEKLNKDDEVYQILNK